MNNYKTIFLGLSVSAFAFINSDTPYALIIILGFVYGLLSSMQFSCMNILTYVDLDEGVLSQGTSIASPVQQLSMGFGVTFCAILLRLFLS